MSPFSKKTFGKRPSLKEEVQSLDRDLLALLVRRYNLLQHMRGSRGYLLSAEEKLLREAWGKEASRYSQDPRITSTLFSLLQDATFFPKPKEETDREASLQGFNLAPAQKPVSLTLDFPASRWHVLAWATLATFSGQQVLLKKTATDDAQHALLRVLKDLGASIHTEEESVALSMQPQGVTEDSLSLHMGSSLDVFGLLAGQFIVRPSRMRMTAEGTLKSFSLSSLAKFFPTLGARLVYVVPKTSSFPIRLECSGVLPKTIEITKDLPTAFVLGLLLALPNAEAPVTLDLSAHPKRSLILELAMPILQEAQAQAGETAPYCIQVNPGPLSIPEEPVVPCDTVLASFLLALPLILGGEGSFKGLWPDDSASKDCLAFLEDLGLSIQNDQQSATVHVKARGFARNQDPTPFSAAFERCQWRSFLPLQAAIAAAYTLQGASWTPPPVLVPVAHEFFNALGFKYEEGTLSASEEKDRQIFWNAPSAPWALALATAACMRKGKGFRLGNSGIITEIWPRYWGLYNRLPGSLPKTGGKEVEQTPKRRRFLTETLATLPPEEDE